MRWLEQIQEAFDYAATALQAREVAAGDVVAYIGMRWKELDAGEALAVVEAARTEAAQAIEARNRTALAAAGGRTR